MKLDPNKNLCGNIIIYELRCGLLFTDGECKECYEKENLEPDGQGKLF